MTSSKLAFVLFAALLRFSNVLAQEVCPDEISPQPNGDGTVTEYKWSTELNYGNPYYSEPLCLGSNKEILYRFCQGIQWDEWFPAEAPICLGKSQTEPRRCPEDLEEFLDQGNEMASYCYVYTEPQTFPPECPYSGQLAISELEHWQPNEASGFIWFHHVHRNLPFGHGRYVYNIPIFLYGQPVVEGTYINYKNMAYKCVSLLSVDTTTIDIQEENCTELIPALCMYDNQPSIHPGCPKDCLYSHYTLNMCYCRAQNDYTTVANPPPEECSELVDMWDKPYLNYLVRILVGEDAHCSIGLQKDEDGRFIWISSQNEVDYTNWDNKVDFNKVQGAIQTNGRWILIDPSESTCQICQVPMTEYLEPTLELYIPRNTKKLYLKVSNNDSLAYVQDTKLSVFCFTNAIQGEVQTRFDMGTFKLLEDKSDIPKTVFYEIPITELLGYWWCDAFQLPNMTWVQSNIVLASAANFVWNFVIIGHLDCDGIQASDPVNCMTAAMEELKPILSGSINDFNVQFVYEDAHFVHAYYHLMILDDLEIPLLDYYVSLNDILQTHIPSSPTFKMIAVLSSDACMAENMTCTGGLRLSWPFAFLGETTLPDKICLQPTGDPVTRKCSGQYETGAVWNATQGNCTACKKLTGATAGLQNVKNGLQEMNAEDILQVLDELLQDPKQLGPVDISLIAEILKYLVNKGEIDSPKVLNLVGKVMDVPRNVLAKSQKILNATDSILSTTDESLLQQSSSPRQESPMEIKTPNMYSMQVDLANSNVRGVAIYRYLAAKSFENYKMIFLYKDDSLEDIVQKEYLGHALITATMAPESVLREARRRKGQKNARLIVLAFLRDSLFNQNRVGIKGKMDNVVLSVTLTDFWDSANDTLIPIAFHKPSVPHDQDPECVFWLYGRAPMSAALEGSWATDEGAHAQENASRTHVICYYPHLTHFGLLVTGNPKDDELSEADITALTILTAIGCALSILGILGIFLTAALFKTWRSSKGNVFLLNISFSILLQTIFMYLATLPDDQKEPLGKWGCICVGVVLHYVILSEFLWMLVIALLQYRRFVQVLTAEPQNIVMKACAFAWGVPLLPVIILLAVSPDNYAEGGSNCYPTGLGLYLSILTPIGLVVAVNLVLFYKIIVSLCCNREKVYGSEYNLMLAVVKLSILLFFMLGFTWLFGILVALGAGVVFAYLFCLTAPLQGLVLFVFFIVSNSETRKLWQNILKSCCHWNEEETNKTSTSSQRMSSTKYY